jgi:hypothetical protein
MVVRPVAAAPPAVPARLVIRAPLVRDQRRNRVPGQRHGWSEPLYRAWYLFGAFGVAVYLGMGTIYLLNRTRFGYFVAASFALAGLFSYLTSVKYAREGTPASDTTVLLVVATTIAAAIVIALVTRWNRRLVGHLTMAILGVASVVVAWATLTATIASPGYAVDDIGIPVGTAMPADLRILTPPFNIVGAFALSSALSTRRTSSCRRSVSFASRRRSR